MNPINYIKSTRAELKHVSWPTRDQAVRYTALVILLSLIVAALLGAFDYFFGAVLEEFVIESVPSTAPAPSDVPSGSGGVNIPAEGGGAPGGQTDTGELPLDLETAPLTNDNVSDE